MKSSERKKHTSWKDLPSFFDVSGSVSVATFGARRLPEIKALWSHVEQQDTQIPSISAKSLESGGGKKSSRHLRRRTTSYKRRIRHRFPTAEKPPSKSQCRKSRRRRLHLLELQQQPTQPCTEECSMPRTVHWIANHIWHAKRFHMAQLWDWQIPMLHVNRGAKAALRLAQERALIHEASWCHRPIVCTCSDWLAVQRVIPLFVVSNVSSRPLRVGSGIAYEVDSFPKHALGPITWIVTRNEGLFDSGGSLSVVLLVHPCIQPSVLRELNSIDGLEACMYTEEKFCCLSIRGFQPEACLTNAVLGQFSPEAQRELVVFLQNTSMIHSDAVQLKSSDKTKTDVIIVREATRDITVSVNRGVTGFDIYCFAAVAKPLFQSLVLTGGAAPIGLTEWSHLLQEAHPPLPVFPREWPDTLSGVEYWHGDGAWSTVRRYLEGGIGRVDCRGPPLCSVVWSDLVEGNESEAMDVVIVRGFEFGKPFQDALLASGSSYSVEEVTQKPVRRLRRSPSSAFVRIPKLSVENAHCFQESCKSLIQSLSLPALLLCHITVIGKGVIGPNDKVFSKQGELGIVTSGSFSPSRGHFHGIAMIGASRFLSHIAADVADGSSTSAVRECDGKRSIQFGVSVRRGDQYVSGTLALIL